MRFEDVEIQRADDDDNQKRVLYNVSLLVTYANAAVDDKSDVAELMKVFVESNS